MPIFMNLYEQVSKNQTNKQKTNKQNLPYYKGLTSEMKRNNGDCLQVNESMY